MAAGCTHGLDVNECSSGTLKGSGIAKLIPHASPEAVELMTKLIAYNPVLQSYAMTVNTAILSYTYC